MTLGASRAASVAGQVLAVCLALAGCRFDDRVEATVRCASDRQCPSGMRCDASLRQCVALDDAEVSERRVSPAWVRAGVPLVASFRVAGPVARAPVFTLLTADGQRRGGFVARDPGDGRFLQSLTLVGSEAEGRALVLADVALADGRFLAGVVVGAVTLDFTPPRLLRRELVLRPASDNALVGLGAATAARAAAAGTVVEARLEASEVLSTPPLPFVPEAAGPFVFSETAATPDWPLVFSATTPTAAVEGRWPVACSLSDLAGNRAEAPLGEVEVDTTPPPPPDVDTEGRLVFRRAPDGTLEAPGVARYSLRGRPGAVAGAGFLRALTRGYPIGGTRAQDDGSFGEAPLTLLSDTVDVSVQAIDFAGNVSQPRAVRSMERVQRWGADAGLEVVERPVAVPCRNWTGDRPATASPGLVRGGYRRSLPRSVSTVPASIDRKMWFDVDHQVLVLASTSMNWFGGDLHYHAWAGTHWEAFGAGSLNQGHSLSSAVYWPEFRSPVVITSTTQLSSWLDVQLDDDSLDRRARPSPCVGGADVPRRLSSWSWNDVARNAWEGRGVGAAYDARRSELLYFGGERFGQLKQGGLVSLVAFGNRNRSSRDADVRVMPTDGVQPPPRMGHLMVYDVLRGQVVVFGGLGPSGLLGDTWVYAEGRWRNVTPTFGPAPRVFAAATWDGARGQVLLHGGQRLANSTGTPSAAELFDDTWAWDGSRWSPLGTGPRTSRAAMAYSPVERRSVLVEGVGVLPDAGGGATNTTWLLEGGTWRRDAPVDAGPRGEPEVRLSYSPSPWERFSAESLTAVFDPSRNASVLFGGRATWFDSCSGDCNSPPPQPFLAAELWQWREGRGFDRLEGDGGGPSPRAGASLAVSATGELTLFGGAGEAGPLGDEWRFHDGGWRPGAAGPSPREGAGLAVSLADGTLVLHGGQTDAGPNGETWERRGDVWTMVSDGGPAGQASLSWNPLRQQVVLASQRQGFFARTGTQWAAVARSVPLEGTLVHDSRRGQALFLGRLTDGGNGLYALSDGGLEFFDPDVDVLAATYNPGARRVEAFGVGGKVSLYEAERQRPAMVAQAAVGPVFRGVPGRLSSISLRARTGGRGFVDGGAVAGVELLAWQDQTFERVERSANNAPLERPDWLVWTTDAPLVVSRMVGLDPVLFLLQPQGVNEVGTAELRLDQLEVVLGVFLSAERGDGG